MEREVIYGYGPVFRRDRRMYSFPDGKGGRTRLPVTGGLPLRSIAYFAAGVAVMFVLSKVWIIGFFIGLFPWPVYFLVPGAAAYALTQIQPDGRPAWRWLSTFIWHRVVPTDSSAGRRLPRTGAQVVYAPVVAIADNLDDPALPCGVVHGPALVTFRDDVCVREGRGRRHVARPAMRRGQAIRAGVAVELEPGERLVVRR